MSPSDTTPTSGLLTARRAEMEDVPRVVSVLTSAFYHDPAWSWAMPDPALRRQQQAFVWEQFLAGAMRYRWVWLTGDGAAASVWIPPGGTEFTPEQEEGFEPLLREKLGPAADRVLTALDLFDEAHPHDEPHFFLDLLGTHDEHRGRGVGLGLLEQNLRLVDEAGMPAYLEASNLGNVALYERYGFRRRGAFSLPDGPDVVTMWRDARGA